MRQPLCRSFFTFFLCLTLSPTLSLAQENITETGYPLLANDVSSLQDTYTPFGVQLCAIYKRSYAHKTITERTPESLARTIGLLTLNKEEIIRNYGQSSADEIDQVIRRIGDLRNEIMANEPLKPLVRRSNEINISDYSKNIDVWNNYLTERTMIEGKVPRWYSTIWIYHEPYMFQRIAQAFHLTETLRSYDPFFQQKKELFDDSIDSVIELASYTLSQLDRGQNVSSDKRKIELIKFLKLALWGNRRDLSITSGASNSQVGDPVGLLSSLDEYILVDDTELVWNVLTEARTAGKEVTVDVVLDNSGFELFTDLCLASFLIAHNLTDKIRFYVKKTPWFISDVTPQDFHWVLRSAIASSNSDLARLGELFGGYLESGVWSIEEESFWTSPFLFSEMARRDPALYAKLSKADLILFKGDLNYRKLVGDINWEYTTTFLHALQGFLPSNLVSLRTVKADLCVGLKPRQGETINATNPDWMITGQYGLIQGATVANNRAVEVDSS